VWKDIGEGIRSCKDLFSKTPAEMQYKVKKEDLKMAKTKIVELNAKRVRTAIHLPSRSESY